MRQHVHRRARVPVAAQCLRVFPAILLRPERLPRGCIPRSPLHGRELVHGAQHPCRYLCTSTSSPPPHCAPCGTHTQATTRAAGVAHRMAVHYALTGAICMICVVHAHLSASAPPPPPQHPTRFGGAMAPIASQSVMDGACGGWAVWVPGRTRPLWFVRSLTGTHGMRCGVHGMRLLRKVPFRDALLAPSQRACCHAWQHTWPQGAAPCSSTHGGWPAAHRLHTTRTSRSPNGPGTATAAALWSCLPPSGPGLQVHAHTAVTGTHVHA